MAKNAKNAKTGSKLVQPKHANNKSISRSSPSLCSDNIKDCMAIKRLLVSLSYYNTLNTHNNNNDQALFCDFMDTIYQSQIYDDVYHLTKYHQNEIESILNLAIIAYKMEKCDLSHCTHSNRHFRVKQLQKDNNNNNNNKYFNLYEETMDTIHFYVFHLIQGGLRVTNKSKVDEDEKEDEEKEHGTQYFDSSFKRMSSIIKQTKTKTNRFGRLNGNKYNISVVNEPVADDGDGDGVAGDDVDTFLDTVYSYLEVNTNNNNINNNNIGLLLEILTDNGYDTESLDLDLEIFKSDEKSNLSQLLGDNNKGILKEVVKVFEKAKGFVLF